MRKVVTGFRLGATGTNSEMDILRYIFYDRKN